MAKLAKVVAAWDSLIVGGVDRAWDRLVSVLRPYLPAIFVFEGVAILVLAAVSMSDWIFWPLAGLAVVAWMAWVYLTD